MTHSLSPVFHTVLEKLDRANGKGGEIKSIKILTAINMEILMTYFTMRERKIWGKIVFIVFIKTSIDICQVVGFIF